MTPCRVALVVLALSLVAAIADPPAPDTLTILDVRSFPPRAVAEIEVKHTVAGPPQSVALTPDEKLSLVSAPNRVDPNDRTKLLLEDALQIVDPRLRA